MKIQALSLLFIVGLSAVFLSGCGTGTGVEVMPQTVALQTTETFPPVPVSHVRVSSHPPKGHYQIIYLVTAEAGKDEPLDHFLGRLQIEAAALGGDYVWVMGAQDDSENVSDELHADRPVSTGSHRQGDIASAYLPRHANTRTAMTASVLKIFSGSNEPDLSRPPSILR